MSDTKKGTGANKMFLQWCRDELVLSFIFVQRFVSWDKTRLRKGTTAETQTLAVRLKDDNETEKDGIFKPAFQNKQKSKR